MAQAFVPVSSLGLFPCRFNSRHSLCCPPLHCLLPLLGCSPPPATQSSPLILWEGAQMSPPLRTNHHPWRELGTFCVHGFCWTSLLTLFTTWPGSALCASVSSLTRLPERPCLIVFVPSRWFLPLCTVLLHSRLYMIIFGEMRTNCAESKSILSSLIA